MKIPNRARERMVHLAIAIVLGASTGCADNDAESRTMLGKVTPPVGPSAAAVRAREDIHANNRYDWIGRAHNEALQEFTELLRQPGRIGSLCRTLAEFSSQLERVPVQRRPALRMQDSAQARRELERSLCAEARDVRGTLASFSATPRQTTSVLSAEAKTLISAVYSAIRSASDSYDLAFRLSPILSQAGTLDTLNNAAVSISVSIAQSSVENAEAELPGYVDVIEAEYGDCARGYLNDGYNFSDTKYMCIEGKDREWETLGPRKSPARVRLAARTSAPGCPVGLSNGFRRVGEKDVYGAVSGFTAGFLRTGSSSGAGLAALAGGIGSSAAEYVKVGWEMWKCSMGII